MLRCTGEVGCREKKHFIFGQILTTISLLCLISIRIWPKEDPPPSFENRLILQSGHKLSTAHKVPRSHRNKMGITHVRSGKQGVLPPVITKMVLWQLMHLDAWYIVKLQKTKSSLWLIGFQPRLTSKMK